MNGLWHKVIASIYKTRLNGWDANMMVRWSHECPSNVISQGFQLFYPLTCLVVGKEKIIRFYEDIWCVAYIFVPDIHRPLCSVRLIVKLVTSTSPDNR